MTRDFLRVLTVYLALSVLVFAGIPLALAVIVNHQPLAKETTE